MSTAPVLDDAALHRLGEQLGSPEVLCRFLRRYLSLLDGRICRLEQALAASDQDAWMDAVLSLKTSSSMAGAQALAARAEELQRESAAFPSWCAPQDAAQGASAPGPPRRVAALACLRSLAVETAGQLRSFLQQVYGPAPDSPGSPSSLGRLDG